MVNPSLLGVYCLCGHGEIQVRGMRRRSAFPARSDAFEMGQSVPFVAATRRDLACFEHRYPPTRLASIASRRLAMSMQNADRAPEGQRSCRIPLL
jgi:hypothetical protein